MYLVSIHSVVSRITLSTRFSSIPLELSVKINTTVSTGHIIGVIKILSYCYAISQKCIVVLLSGFGIPTVMLNVYFYAKCTMLSRRICSMGVFLCLFVYYFVVYYLEMMCSITQ